MKIVVATDIHGVNAQLREQLAVLGEPIIVSPWPGEGQPFASEEQAASVFHARDGLAEYEKRIAAAVDGEAAVLIGFSVGATSLWRYIAGPQCHPASRCFLYYGSRIRDCAGLLPRCQASLFFAEHEASFHPQSLIDQIAGSGAFCALVPGTRHGFMNPLSAHYRFDIATEHFGMIRRCMSITQNQ